MTRIVLCSDNHFHYEVIEKILNENPNADYYWHLGDSEFYDIKRLNPFISVKGNNDFAKDLPDYRIINVKGINFLLIHGHRQLFCGIENLAKFANEKKCDVVLYGHTHNTKDIVVKNVRLINPGSCFYNRNGEKPTYCILNINSNGILTVEFKTIKVD